MRKKVVYLGVSFVILGIILVVMGFFMLSDLRNFESYETILLVRSIMNWLGITFSIGGAVTIIIGVCLDEQLQVRKVDSTNQQLEEKKVVGVEIQQQSDKTNYCLQCGAKLEVNQNYCSGCGTKSGIQQTQIEKEQSKDAVLIFKKRHWIYTAIIIIIVITILFVIFS